MPPANKEFAWLTRIPPNLRQRPPRWIPTPKQRRSRRRGPDLPPIERCQCPISAFVCPAAARAAADVVDGAVGHAANERSGRVCEPEEPSGSSGGGGGDHLDRLAEGGGDGRGDLRQVHGLVAAGVLGLLP